MLNTQEIYEYLHKNFADLEIRQKEKMANHTSWKVGGNADLWLKIKTIEQLTQILQYAKENKIPVTVLGNGSNVLVKDKGIRGITMQIDFQKIELHEQEKKVEVFVEAGVKLGMLASLLQKKGVSGLEFACRYSRHHRRCYSHECWSLWKRNERNCKRSNLFTRKW